MLAQCNADFLPLVNENNIIRVNDVPFVKLGVIGKGGSSKVYRVLSKSCCVLAIKKVKLGNLDQKAIDGYANEIALLKKLQGNPSIIQMHDSEIDLSRKAIFLAMEVGEVDLNHVLQQQTLQSAKKGNGDQPSLNMNFIRLTWQQMLSAVHFHSRRKNYP
jgi:serine/threonine protein kinase